jgi:excisionase family DNA binding protein
LLDEISKDPARLEGLDARTLAVIALRLNTLASAVAAQLQLALVDGSTIARHRNGTDANATDGRANSIAGLLVNAAEMAHLLSVPESWIRTEQRAGRIPFIKAGRYVRFRPSEVEHALHERNHR